MMDTRKPIQRNSLLQGLQCLPVLQLPCYVANATVEQVHKVEGYQLYAQII
jgi:hypothetical protein